MKIESQTVIKAPLDEVFHVFTDLENAKERISGINELEIIDPPAQMQLGTKWREVRTVFGKEAEETMWVTEFNPNQNYVVEAESHGSHYRSEYQFEEKDGGVLVKMTFEGTPLTLSAKLMGLLFIFFAKSTKKLLEQDMQDLKTFLEKQ